MRKDTITLYHNLGDDENGKSKWQRTVIRNTSVFRRDGIRQTVAQNLQSSDTLQVYIHFDSSRADRMYTDGPLDERQLGMYYTVSADGRDRIFLGESSDNSPIEENNSTTRRVISVQHNDSSVSARLRNIRLTCE